MGKRKTGVDLYRNLSMRTKEEARTPRQKRESRSVPAEKENRGTPPPPASPLVEGFLKMAHENPSALAGNRKIAPLLFLLGKEESSRVMAQFSPEEAAAIASQMATMKTLPPRETQRLLEEFSDYIGERTSQKNKGGKDIAREILVRAFGEEKAKQSEALRQALPQPFAFLSALSFSQLMTVIRKESPPILALILAHIPPQQASAVLEALPREKRRGLILNLAQVKKISKKVIATVAATLQEKIRLLGKDESENFDGPAALASILRCMNLKDEQRLLGDLELHDPSLAEDIKAKVFTQDIILQLRKRDLEHALSETKEKDIALMLKSNTPEIRDRIKDSLSRRRRLLVADEDVFLGAISPVETDLALKAFLLRLRTKEEEGTYLIVREQEDFVE